MGVSLALVAANPLWVRVKTWLPGDLRQRSAKSSKLHSKRVIRSAGDSSRVACGFLFCFAKIGILDFGILDFGILDFGILDFGILDFGILNFLLVD